MSKKPTKKLRVEREQAGASPISAARRQQLFVEAYLSNGQNASSAAAAAGSKGGRLDQAGWRMLKHPEVQALITARAQSVAEAAEMSTANWARELSGVAFSKIGELLGPDGKLLPVHMLPAHVQAAISSVKATPDGDAVEYKFWDKNAALQTMARHLGLFERDNAQRKEDVRVRIELVS